MRTLWRSPITRPLSNPCVITIITAQVRILQIASFKELREILVSGPLPSLPSWCSSWPRSFSSAEYVSHSPLMVMIRSSSWPQSGRQYEKNAKRRITVDDALRILLVCCDTTWISFQHPVDAGEETDGEAVYQ